MKRVVVSMVVISCLFMLSCGSLLTLTEADAWLSSKAGNQSPAVNISGKWQDALEEGWGMAQLDQKGSDVTGTIERYSIKGVVNGNSIYLVMFHIDIVDFTANLEVIDANELKGNYYSSRDKEQAIPKPMVLKRVK